MNTNCLSREPSLHKNLRQAHTHLGKDGKTSEWILLLSAVPFSTMLSTVCQADLVEWHFPNGDPFSWQSNTPGIEYLEQTRILEPMLRVDTWVDNMLVSKYGLVNRFCSVLFRINNFNL
jgi:hypothetical protein